MDEQNLNEDGEIKAADVFKILQQNLNWTKGATYTVLGRLLEKGAISRRYPSYTIKSLLSKDEFSELQMEKFIDIGMGNSFVEFFAGFVKKRKVNKRDLEEMKRIIEDAEKIELLDDEE